MSVGGFQGYQVIGQKESAYKTTSTIASLPTIGFQFQFQTTFGSNYGLRIKYEVINVKFQAPQRGQLGSDTFRTSLLTMELPSQHDLHWQTFFKISNKERVLFNLDETFVYNFYKSQIYDFGYGINFDSQNLGGLVTGVGSTFSLLYFKSKDIENKVDHNLGMEFEIRAKLGWVYEKGWGNILRASYSTFYMPNNIDKNTGKEIRFFGELIKVF